MFVFRFSHPTPSPSTPHTLFADLYVTESSVTSVSPGSRLLISSWPPRVVGFRGNVHLNMSQPNLLEAIWSEPNAPRASQSDTGGKTWTSLLRHASRDPGESEAKLFDFLLI